MPTTLSGTHLPDFRRPRSPRDVLALAVIWSVDEPQRVGEICLPPSQNPGILGREGGHLPMLRLRPGRRETTEPISNPRISRQQLNVQATGTSLTVVNLGRLPLLVNGSPATESIVHPGDVLELQNQLALLVVRRPRALLPDPHPTPDHAYGEIDDLGFIGESPEMWSLRSQIRRLSRRSGHVLIHGPSGSGKEVVARAIHRLSSEVSGSLISRNAATLPEGLVDAELFGNVANYPNPGMRSRPGLIGEADGGTLFLDEIGELPLALQAHLLRVMDSGEYQRLGEAVPREVSVPSSGV